MKLRTKPKHQRNPIPSPKGPKTAGCRRFWNEDWDSLSLVFGMVFRHPE
jgi:hypothetical protein